MEHENRKPNRLQDYDYGEIGCYFVTICTHHRQHLFKIENARVGNGLCAVPISPPNQTIHKWLAEIPNKFDNVQIDQYVIMPDHLHLIVNIQERHAGRSLPDVIHFFKTMTTNAYIQGVKNGALAPFHQKLWQKSYYDHVIRNQQDYNEVWEYIENNPVKWQVKTTGEAGGLH